MMHSYDLHFFSLSHPLGFHICQPSRNLDFFLLLLGHDSTLNFHLLTQDLFALQIRCVSSNQLCLQHIRCVSNTSSVSPALQVCLQYFRCVCNTSVCLQHLRCVSNTSGVSPACQVCLQNVRCVSRISGVYPAHQVCLRPVKCVSGMSGVSSAHQVCLEHVFPQWLHSLQMRNSNLTLPNCPILSLLFI